MVREPAERSVARISAATGVSSAAVRAMTLGGLPTGVGCASGPLSPISTEYPRKLTSFWLATAGSRYCPRCLAESGGRWKLRWRLRWAFACRTHRRVLVDDCPSCGGSPRTRFLIGRRPLRCRCCEPVGDSKGPTVCGHRLDTVAATDLADDHPVLLAQERIDALLDSEIRGMHVGLSGLGSLCVPLLCDVRDLARILVAHADPAVFGELGENFEQSIRGSRAEQPPSRRTIRCDVSAACWAPAVVVALRVLGAVDRRTAESELLRALGLAKWGDADPILAGHVRSWTQHSPEATAIWQPGTVGEHVRDGH